MKCKSFFNFIYNYSEKNIKKDLHTKRAAAFRQNCSSYTSPKKSSRQSTTDKLPARLLSEMTRTADFYITTIKLLSTDFTAYSVKDR